MPLRDGHWRALEQLEHPSAYRTTRDQYAACVGKHGVYLRPTNAGFTVLSLDYERCKSMIGVGGRDTTQHSLRRLPPSPEQVQRACDGYRDKFATLARPSEEERYAITMLARALDADLSLPEAGLFFVNQEWRLPDNSRIDVLAVDLVSRRFVVIELKSSQRDAQKNDANKGGDAWAQATHYAGELHRHREQLYPFFERLARALARHHDAPEELRTLRVDPDHVPDTRVWWPGAPRVLGGG